MNYWLFKSEPSSWSWNDQLEAGKKGEGWDGVRNYQAANNMKNMKRFEFLSLIRCTKFSISATLHF